MAGNTRIFIPLSHWRRGEADARLGTLVPDFLGGGTRGERKTCRFYGGGRGYAEGRELTRNKRVLPKRRGLACTEKQWRQEGVPPRKKNARERPAAKQEGERGARTGISKSILCDQQKNVVCLTNLYRQGKVTKRKAVWQKPILGTKRNHPWHLGYLFGANWLRRHFGGRRCVPIQGELKESFL